MTNLPNNLEINWGKKPENNFHLQTLTQATCFYDPAVGPPNPPRAGCNTMIGHGIGLLNGISGHTIDTLTQESGGDKPSLSGRLRPGLRFSDGSPVTPQDVVASLGRIEAFRRQASVRAGAGPK